MNKKIYNGHLIRDYLGQVFLVNKFFIKKIIYFFNPKSGENIVEIGPGLGALTFPILNKINNMTLIELDNDLAFFFLKNKKYRDKLNVIIKDASKVDYGLIAKKNNLPIRIIGNLPYYISIPLIFHLFNYIDCIQDMCFMFQKEVADRLLAKKDNKNYGFLSIITQYMCKVVKLIMVPSCAFIPEPKVDSMVVSLIPYKKNPYPICDIKCLCFIVKKAFSQRRKIIKNSLSGIFDLEDFKRFKINPNSRAENLSINDYCNLSIKFFSTFK